MIDKMNYTRFDDFYKIFKVQDEISFDEFKKNLVSDKGTPLTKFFDNDKLFRVLYNLKFDDHLRRKFFKQWFDSHLRVRDINDQLFFRDKILNRNYIVDDIIYGKDFINKSRIIKNLNFDKIYNTQKIYHHTIFKVFRLFFEKNILYNVLHSPTCKRFWLENNLTGIFDYLRGTTNFASVMNPVFIKYIFDNFLVGENMFTPTLGWDSYLVAFFNSDFKEYVGVDVMDCQIENARKLTNYYNSINNNLDGFFNIESDVKKVNVVNCPSEKFEFKSDYFDNVFFSPPYFDLEKYQGGEQSIKNYPDYDSWLKNYWEKTLQNCYDMLKRNGLFVYIISDYKQKNGNLVTVSKDTYEISKKYFQEHKVLKIVWKNFSTKSPRKNKNGNFENMFMLRK